MTTLEIIGQLALMLSILSSAALLGGNLFDMLVNEPNLVRGFPASLDLIRRYWVHKNPGDFFRALTPIFSLSTLTALVIFWPITYGRRYLLLGALASILLTQLITVVYFFPRNEIIRSGSVAEVEKHLRSFRTSRFFWETVRNALTVGASLLAMWALTQPVPPIRP